MTHMWQHLKQEILIHEIPHVPGTKGKLKT